MDVSEIGNERLNSANGNADTEEPRTENTNQSLGSIQLSARSASDTLTVHESAPPMVGNQSANSSTSNFISHQDLLRQQAHAPASFTSTNSNYLNAHLSSSSTTGNVSIQAQNQNTTSTTAATTTSNNTTTNNGISVPLHLPTIRSVPRIEELNIAAPRYVGRGPPEAEIDHNILSSPASSTASVSGWSLVTDNNGGAPPPTRSLHAAAVLNKVMYVFGGYDGTTRVNTFHAYSFAEKRWSPVHAIGGPPGPRDRHVAFAFGFKFFVHGGFNGTSRVSDFWGFDLSSMTWREVVVLGGRPPSPRHSHSAVVHRHSLYIYGGYDGSYKSDLHEFDFTTSQWTLVPSTGRRPRPRYRATAVVHKNLMILYGGHDGTRHLSDTHVFDFESRVWSSLITEGPSPVPRDSHIAVVHSSSMYIFGGSSGNAMNDLHELQLPSNASLPAKWRPVTSAGIDEPRARFCSTAVVYNDALFIFGGYDGSVRLNDFVRFDFAVYDLSFEVPPSTLGSELRAMVDDETLSDVTFLVEGIPVYAHKLMLTRCSYFRALFLGEMMESKMSTVPIEQVSHQIFLLVLEYLYTDQLQIPLEHAMELFEAADLFCIPRLKTMCEKRMLQSINIDNAAAIFDAADMHSALALRQKAKKYIMSHFELISKTTSFEEMGRRNIDLLFELLQSR